MFSDVMGLIWPVATKPLDLNTPCHSEQEPQRVAPLSYLSLNTTRGAQSKDIIFQNLNGHVCPTFRLFFILLYVINFCCKSPRSSCVGCRVTYGLHTFDNDDTEEFSERAGTSNKLLLQYHPVITALAVLININWK